jgi:hypothetical protein
MGGAPQVVMRVASQIWQVIFASQTLQVFCLALRKWAQYVVVIISLCWNPHKQMTQGIIFKNLALISIWL